MIVLIKELELDMNELNTSKFLKFYAFKFKKFRNFIKSEISIKEEVSDLLSACNSQYNLLKNIQYVYPLYNTNYYVFKNNFPTVCGVCQ